MIVYSQLVQYLLPKNNYIKKYPNTATVTLNAGTIAYDNLLFIILSLEPMIIAMAFSLLLEPN